jgi:hypothetical protein
VKQRLVLEVLVEDGQAELVQWGDWGRAARLSLSYCHPKTGLLQTIDEFVRVPTPDAFELRRDVWAKVLCWGVLPIGRLRHPVFVGWTDATESRKRRAGSPSPRRP